MLHDIGEKGVGSLFDRDVVRAEPGLESDVGVHQFLKNGAHGSVLLGNFAAAFVKKHLFVVTGWDGGQIEFLHDVNDGVGFVRFVDKGGA